MTFVEVEVEEDTGFGFEVYNYFVLAAVHKSVEVVVDPAAVVAGIGYCSFAAAAAAADYSILVGHKVVVACRKFGLALDFDY
jgi:predicted alpha/beta hydrolase